MDQFLSAKFLSGRNANVKAGISGVTTNTKVIEAVGRVGIGSTIFDPITDLDVRGSANIRDTLIVNGINVSGGSSLGITNLSQLYVSGVSTFAGITTVTGSTLFTKQLNVSGASTLTNLGVSGATTTQHLNVAGVSTLSGYVDVGGSVDINGGLEVSGITTLAATGGITTTGGDLYVGGDLYIRDDLFFDEFTARNANITGVATIGTLGVSGVTTTQHLNVAGVSTLGVITSTQLYVSGVSTFAGITTVTGSTLFSRQLNVSGVSTLGVTTVTRLTAQSINSSGIVTGSTFRPSTGYIQAADGTNAFYIYDGTGNVAFQGTIGASQINNSQGYKVIGFAGTNNATFENHVYISGITTSVGGFVGDLTGTATTATKLQNARTFEITGDIIASPISFDGTGNVSLAATIQPNSVALGSDTTGDYVQTVTGTSNQITVTGGTGEGSTPTLSIPSQFTAPQDVTVTRDLQVTRNLNVTGNITIGGTSATIFSQTLTVSDPDIVLGYRTDAFGNDVSNDTTANHGGIAIASTEGSPLVQLFITGIETTPATYKKIMWFKSGTFAGLNTDAWLSNYAIGIGSTQFPSGTRLAAGSVQFTENDLSVVRNINASGIITGTLANTLTLNTSGTGLSGSATYNNSGTTTFTVTSNATSNNTPSTIVARDASGNFSAGTITANLTGTASTASFATTAFNLSDAANITTGTINSARLSGTYNIDINGNATTADYADVAGIATNVIGGIASVTSLNVSGIATISVNSSSDALRITQEGSGNALVVEDSTNPDSTPFVVTATGRVGIGTSIPSERLHIYDGGYTRPVIEADTEAGIYLKQPDSDPNGYNSILYNSYGNVGLRLDKNNGSGYTNFIFEYDYNNLQLNFQSGGWDVIKAYGTSTSGEGRAVVIGDGQKYQYIGGLTKTGTPYQPLQVKDGAYIGGNLGIGSTNPLSKLSVVGDGNFTGVVTAASFSGNASSATYASNAGVSTSVIGGIASVTQLSVSGVSTFNNNVSVGNGITMYAATGIISAIAFYGSGQNLTDIIAAKLAGVSIFDEGTIVGSAFQFSGLNFVGDYVTATGIGTTATITFTRPPYADVAGIATYATNAGVSTSVIGGIASVTQLNVSGVSTLGTVKISSGIITATSGVVTYYGDGSQLQGIISVAGISVQDEGSPVGTSVTTLNFSGASVSVSNAVNGISTVTIIESGIAIYATNAGIATNLKGGVAGNVPYQSATDTTTFVSNGLPGQVLLFNGSIPVWGNVSAASGAFGGISVQDEGTPVGTANSITTLDFRGNNIIVTATGGANGIATITMSDNIVGSALSISGISTLGVTSTTNLNAQQLNVSGVSTFAGVTTHTAPLFGTQASFTGVVTASSFSGNASSATYATNAGVATALQNARDFSITGSFVTATAISFNGTGNVALAATITPDSIGLGTYTTGDYVQSITGTSNQITVTGGTGEGSTPTLSIPNQFTAPQDVTVTRDLQVNRNLNVNGNITIGGTSATIFSQSLNIFDPDIVLGYRTDANGNDIATDNTANHGGIAIASTEGNPLVQLFIAGIETNPATYKKIMWFKSGTFSGLNTDAWISNYAIGIGSTQFPTGTRLAAGSVQFTENDLAVVRNINASGISTFGNLNVNNSTTELSSIVNIRKASGGNLTAQFDSSGTATLYFDGTQRLQTSSNGVVINGNLTVQANGNISAGSLDLDSVSGANGNIKATIGITTLGVTTTTNLTAQQLNVSGVSTIGNFRITPVGSGATVGGIGVTYFGDGSNLTGVSGGVSISTNTTNQNQLITYATSFGSTTGFGATSLGLVFNPSTTRLGIGTTNPQYNLHVIGDFAATSKSFVINHPTKDGKKLRYASLEGPENGVYVRGRTQDAVIELPDYWTGLIDENSITVNLTSIGDSAMPRVESIGNNVINVFSKEEGDLDYYYTVYAERKDIEKLVVEY